LETNGGEGGILANVISRLTAFEGVEPLPQVQAFEAFIREAFGTCSGIWDFESGKQP